MSIQVSSIAELQQVMMEETKKAMDKSSNELINEIKQSVDEVVYSYSPVRYDRTHQLRETLEVDNSQSVSDGTQASIVINHNTGKAGWFSVKDGQGRTDIPEIVTYGGYGYFYGEGLDVYGSSFHNINPSVGRSWSKSRDYMKHAEEKLDGGGYLNRCLSPYLPSYVTIK